MSVYKVALTTIRDLPTDYDLLHNAPARAMYEVARRGLEAPEDRSGRSDAIKSAITAWHDLPAHERKVGKLVVMVEDALDGVER